MRPRLVPVACAALVAAVVACAGTHRISITSPIAPGVEITWTFDVGRRTAEIVGQPGLRLCIEFHDGNGNPVGEPTSATLPASVPVPSGARGFTAVPCPEPEEERSPGPGRGLLPPTAPELVHFGGPLVAGANEPLRQHSVLVRDVDPERARRKAERVAALGPQARVPSGVDVLLWAEAVVDPGAGAVSLVLASPTPFEEVDVALNGLTGAASLEDAVVSASKGWTVATFSLPLEDFSFGPLPGAYSNSWSVRYRTEGRAASLVASGSADVEL